MLSVLYTVRMIHTIMQLVIFLSKKKAVFLARLGWALNNTFAFIGDTTLVEKNNNNHLHCIVR